MRRWPPPSVRPARSPTSTRLRYREPVWPGGSGGAGDQRNAVRRMLSENSSPAKFEVVGDMVIALQAAFGRRTGRDRDRGHRFDRLRTQRPGRDRARRWLGVRHLRRGIRPLDRPQRRLRPPSRATGMRPSRQTEIVIGSLMKVLAPGNSRTVGAGCERYAVLRISRRCFRPCFPWPIPAIASRLRFSPRPALNWQGWPES